MVLKLTIEEVRITVSRIGTLLTNDYKNQGQLLLIQCSTCGGHFQLTLKHFQQVKFCPYCYKIKKKLPEETLQKALKDHGFVLQKVFYENQLSIMVLEDNNLQSFKRRIEMKKKELTVEERMQHPKSQIKKLTNILKTLRDMTRKGVWCEREISETAQKVKVIREIYKTKVKMEDLKEEAS